MKKVVFCVALIFLTCGLAVGANYKVLWSFGGTPEDGAGPVSNLVSDSSGNLYGTTPFGGNTPLCGSCGTAFKLSPNQDGTWSNTVIHAFCTNFVNNQCADGLYPQAGLILDAVGNLYGTTRNGGNVPCSPDGSGCGTVFELSPNPDHSWTETVLYNFCQSPNGNQCLDGLFPVSQLAFDASGNLYGTTASGGSGHIAFGTAFELSPGPSGWTETVLYNFCSLGQGNYCLDGAQPTSGVTFDQSGNLYGTTERSGWANGIGGTVYQLSPGFGGWTETLVHDFAKSRNGIPAGGVSFDSSGNLYGATSYGGSGSQGGVFRVNPDGTVRSFSFNGTNGSQPLAGILIDSKNGSLYGTTTGALAGTQGNVFKIGAKGKETVLHNFCSQTNCADGRLPLASLIQDQSGNLYGTTELGGAYGLGVVYEITP